MLSLQVFDCKQLEFRPAVLFYSKRKLAVEIALIHNGAVNKYKVQAKAIVL